MKNFLEYLTESKKEYEFRVKIAGDFNSDQESKLKNVLSRFTTNNVIKEIKKTKTPIQSLPLDFPKIKNCEVNIFEFTLDYPTTQYELTELLSQELKIPRQNLVVRKPNEPSEEYQEPVEKREGALLNDPDYKEAPNAKFEEYYGDKYNTGFVKELNGMLKEKRKQRGEEIPSPKSDNTMKNPGQTLNDIPQGNVSPVGSKRK